MAIQEILITAIARLMLDPAYPPARHIAVGMASPIPAAACWLLKKQGHKLRISLLQRATGGPFSEGGRELFDLAGQGRIDIFFLSGGQIDSRANINMIGVGEWPGSKVRFPGSFGSAFMYLATPRTILFREEHSPRVLVDKVDHISGAGITPENVWRRGTAQALVTNRCVFTFDGQRFTLASLHPDESLESIAANTAMSYVIPSETPATPLPTAEERALLRGPVCDEMLTTYPDFCRRVWGRTADEGPATANI